jgi:glycerol-3-phosphate dehydrogenase (NAD(P)+)
MNSKHEVVILGAGSFGTALAHSFAGSGRTVRMWARSPDLVNSINSSHTNPKYAPGRILSSKISASADFADCIKSSKVIVYSCPSSEIRKTFLTMSQTLSAQQISELVFVNTAKGLDPDSLELHHEMAQSIFGKRFVLENFFVLSGPSFAAELLSDHVTCLTLAGLNLARIKSLQEQLGSPTFRIYSSNDLVGVQLGGAMKNVIAIAAGIALGMGLGFNTQAALINLGLGEIARLGRALGAKTETFLGLSGMGDLVLTATSELSRNRRYGVLLGQGMTVEEAKLSIGSTIEGFFASKAIAELSRKTSIEASICQEIYKILFDRKPAKVAFDELLSHPLGYEWR